MSASVAHVVGTCLSSASARSNPPAATSPGTSRHLTRTSAATIRPTISRSFGPVRQCRVSRVRWRPRPLLSASRSRCSASPGRVRDGDGGLWNRRRSGRTADADVARGYPGDNPRRDPCLGLGHPRRRERRSGDQLRREGDRSNRGHGLWAVVLTPVSDLARSARGPSSNAPGSGPARPRPSSSRRRPSDRRRGRGRSSARSRPAPPGRIARRRCWLITHLAATGYDAAELWQSSDGIIRSTDRCGQGTRRHLVISAVAFSVLALLPAAAAGSPAGQKYVVRRAGYRLVTRFVVTYAGSASYRTTYHAEPPNPGSNHDTNDANDSLTFRWNVRFGSRLTIPACTAERVTRVVE